MGFAYRNHSGAWVEIQGAFTLGEGVASVQYPANWLELSTPEDRAAIGIAEIVDYGFDATVSRSTATAITDVNDTPVRSYALDPITAAEVAEQRWQEVKMERDQRIRQGAPTPWGRVDAQVEARVNIAGAVQMAVLSRQGEQPFSITWTLFDNSTVSLDADAMIALGVAAGTYVSGCHSRSQELRAVLDQMVADNAPLADIRALDISTGWSA